MNNGEKYDGEYKNDMKHGKGNVLKHDRYLSLY